MADGRFPTLISKDRAANSGSNAIFTTLVDAAGDQIAIDGSGNIGAILAANSGVDIGDVTINNAAGASAVNIQDGGNSITIDDGGGSITVDGTVTTTLSSEKVDDAAFTVATDKVLVLGGFADDTSPDSVDEGDVGALRMTLDRKLLVRLVGASDGNRLDIDASGHAQVDIAAISVTTFPVSKNTSVNSETNPIFVSTVNTVVSGSEIHNYSTATVAADTASNHDYTVAGTTFLCKQVLGSASGAAKFEVQSGPVASLTTKAVFFVSDNGGTERVEFNPPLEVPVTSTGTLRVIRTNRENQSQDLYSTIIGNDI